MRSCAALMFSFHKRASLVACSLIASDSCFSRFAVSSAAATLASNACRASDVCSSRLRVSSAAFDSCCPWAATPGRAKSEGDGSVALIFLRTVGCLVVAEYSCSGGGCPPSGRLCSLVAAGALTADDESRVSPRVSVSYHHSASDAVRRWPVDAVAAAGAPGAGTCWWSRSAVEGGSCVGAAGVGGFGA